MHELKIVADVLLSFTSNIIDILMLVFSSKSVLVTDLHYPLADQDISSFEPEGTDDWMILFFGILVCIGSFVLYKFFAHRVQIQRIVLEKIVDKRTSEISKQKAELEDQSKELQKAYEEIKTKNIAIEEAFEHLSNSFSKLSDLNREKDGMMSIVAHDLRTPLNNIEGLIQLVSMDGNLNDDQKDYISKIRHVVQRGNEMIRDLLDINQAKNQKPELTITSFDLLEFIENWKTHFEKPLSAKNQKLDLNGEFKTISLHSDLGLLSRILDNLMSNAIKFSEKDTKIKLTINSAENDKITIILEDEGPGISEADQLKMFKPFTRLTARPTDGEPSNGLGLSIIKSLTRQLGGKIEVSSTLGEGTSFIITLPLSVESNSSVKSA